MKPRDISSMVVNAARCKTCPFNENGDIDTRNRVQARCIRDASQLCHGTDNKTLCRGARDYQIQIFHRLGILKEPTEKCWNETWAKMKKEKGL